MTAQQQYHYLMNHGFKIRTRPHSEGKPSLCKVYRKGLCLIREGKTIHQALDAVFTALLTNHRIKPSFAN